MCLLSLARVALQMLALLIATAATPASPIASRLLIRPRVRCRAIKRLASPRDPVSSCD